MLSQSLLRRTTQALFPILLLCGVLAETGVGSAQSPSFMLTTQEVSKCADTTDEQIVTAVQEKIKADKRFDDQWKHINVSSQKRVVTLGGWARGRTQVTALYKLARSTKCVRRVVNKMRPSLKVGCGANQQQCGDTCIDRTDKCNLIQGGGPPQ